METALPGFYLYTNLIDETFEQQLLAEIDSQTWIVDYARHLQYYAIVMNWKTRMILYLFQSKCLS
jgi:hypothetical protein